MFASLVSKTCHSYAAFGDWRLGFMPIVFIFFLPLTNTNSAHNSGIESHSICGRSLCWNLLYAVACRRSVGGKKVMWLGLRATTWHQYRKWASKKKKKLNIEARLWKASRWRSWSQASIQIKESSPCTQKSLHATAWMYSDEDGKHGFGYWIRLTEDNDVE